MSLDAGASPLDAGAPLDAAPSDAGVEPSCESVRRLKVSENAYQSSADEIVAVSDGYLAFWQEAPENGDVPAVMVAKLDQAGQRVTLRSLGTVPEDLELRKTPDIIPSEDGAVVVRTNEDNRLQLERLDRDGETIGAPVDLGPGGAAALARSVDGFGVVSVRGMNASPTTLWFQRLDGAGQPVADAHVIVDSGAIDSWPGLAWNGTEYGFVFQRSLSRTERAGLFMRLDAAGQPLTETSSITFARSSAPAIGAYEDGYLVTWSEGGAGARFRFLDSAGGSDGFIQPFGQNQIAMAWTGELYGLASGWFGSPLQIATLSPRGSPEVIASSVAGRRTALNPRLAWDGQGFSVFWTEAVESDTRAAVFFARVCP